jgi:hypothetical protein
VLDVMEEMGTRQERVAGVDPLNLFSLVIRHSNSLKMGKNDQIDLFRTSRCLSH